jgi:hypothetical protein
MSYSYDTLDPPTWSERLGRLRDDLQGLGSRLKVSIAAVVGDAVAAAVRDTVNGWLGAREEYTDPCRPTSDHRPYSRDRDPFDDPWREEAPWHRDEDFASTREVPEPPTDVGKRWRDALGAAVQTGLWTLRRQGGRRPILTTVTVSLAAGVLAFFAGPTLAAGVGVMASVAGLLLTADASASAIRLATD